MAWGAARIACTEVDAWLEIYKQEPWGPAREDLRAGTIASMLSATKGTTPATFFPNLKGEEPDPEDRDAEILATLMALSSRQ